MLNYVGMFLDSNGIWTHNHLIRKRTLNHLAKLAKLSDGNKVGLQSKCLLFKFSELFNWYLPIKYN